ncbi:MAG: ornithine cyclodeaminase family protein [Hyphomicrobiaceae bacterium]|nr:ornithine cyclodeaminase family protein [Hyphomicrobiaceae bacterium]
MAHASTSLLAISRDDVMRLVDPARAIEALAEGFKALSRGEVQAPPRPKVDVPGKGFSLAMLAWAPGRMIALKTVNVFEGNHVLGLESHQALVSLFDAATGAPVAILDGASLTGIRTAAGAVLSVRELARPDARIAIVIGAGVQAREHARQLGLARRFDEIRVFARRLEAAKAIAATVPNGIAVTDLEEAVRSADVVCLTTSATSPVVDDTWIRPGTHVTSVGFAPPGSELPAALVDRATLFVEAMGAFQPAPVGCAELAGREPSQGAELGQMLLGLRPGRTSDEQVTLYKSMGNAMEDMIVANLAYEAAVRDGAGQRLHL